MQNTLDFQYKQLIIKILEYGTKMTNRTGINSLVLPYKQITVPANPFPLITSKYTNFKSIVRELLWFISGSNKLEDLHPCHIWDAWIDGTADYIYGLSWRTSYYCPSENIELNKASDQLLWVIENIKTKPFDRRHIVTSWIPPYVQNVPNMKGLPACHTDFTFLVFPDEENINLPKYIDVSFKMRSTDVMLGLPFNIASYALLLHMVAKEVGLQPRFVNYFGDNVHIYESHIKETEKYIDTFRWYPLPNLILDTSIHKDTDRVVEYTFEDIHLENYLHNGAIAFPIAV